MDDQTDSRHEDTDLAGALRDLVGDDSIEADGAEEESDGSEAADEIRDEAGYKGVRSVIDELIHGSFSASTDVGARLMDGGDKYG